MAGGEQFSVNGEPSSVNRDCRAVAVPLHWARFTVHTEEIRNANIYLYRARPQRRAEERHDRRAEPGRGRRAAAEAAAQRRQDRRGKSTRTKKKGGKITMRDIVIFTRQFSTMINAGLPLVQALDILAQAEREQGAQGRDARGRVRRRVGQHRGRRAAQASQGVHASCTSTWSPPVRRVVFSTRSSCDWRRSWKRTTPSCAR